MEFIFTLYEFLKNNIEVSDYLKISLTSTSVEFPQNSSVEITNFMNVGFMISNGELVHYYSDEQGLLRSSEQVKSLLEDFMQDDGHEYHLHLLK
jgi:hypothetical protein